MSGGSPAQYGEAGRPVDALAFAAAMASRMQPSEAMDLSNGARVRLFRHDSYELVDVPPCEDHMFACRIAGHVRASRKCEGRWQTAETQRNSITVVPSNHRTSWRLDGSGAVLHVYIPPALMRAAAGDALGDHDAMDLVDRLGLVDGRLDRMCDALLRELRSRETGFGLYAETLTTQLAIHLARYHSTAALRAPRQATRFHPRIERQIAEYVDARLAERISLGDMACVAGLGLSQFNQNFRATFGVPPYAFVLARRIERAKALLAEGDLPLVEIALDCGFANQSHLTRIFGRVCGTTPAQYRQALKA